jgi:post-segregation antitoxin (ccd killing protein)
MKAFDVPTPEELIQNLKVREVNMRRGSGTSIKTS